MKLANPKQQEKKPEEGDFRITRHFAWLPTTTSDGLIWLEPYRKIWEYVMRMRYIDMHYGGFSLECGGWDLKQIKRGK